MACRQSRDRPAIITLVFYWQGRSHQSPLCTQAPSLRQSHILGHLPCPLAVFLHFPRAHPERQPWAGVSLALRSSSQKHPQPLSSFPSSQEPLGSSAPCREVTAWSRSPELAAECPGKGPLGSGMCRARCWAVCYLRDLKPFPWHRSVKSG